MRGFAIAAVMLLPSVSAADDAKPKQDAPLTPSVVLRTVSRHALDNTTLTADVVAAKIRAAYLAGITGCYRSHLAIWTAAKGTLTMSFRVDDTGAAIAISAHAFGGDHDKCVLERAKSWRFPIPKTKAGEPEVSDFSLAIDLAPDAPAVAPPRPGTKAPAKKPRGSKSSGLSEEEMAKLAEILTAEASHADTYGDMSRRRPGADLGASLDASPSGRTVAIGGGGARGSSGDGRVGTARGPSVDQRKLDTPAEQGPAPRIAIDNVRAVEPATTLVPDVVKAKMMSAYMAGLKRCYRKRLVVDPAARGKVTLSFTVNETGRTTIPKAKGFDAELDACMAGLMGSWRFPNPKGPDPDATDASFEIVLKLTTDEPAPAKP